MSRSTKQRVAIRLGALVLVVVFAYISLKVFKTAGPVFAFVTLVSVAHNIHLSLERAPMRIRSAQAVALLCYCYGTLGSLRVLYAPGWLSVIAVGAVLSLLNVYQPDFGVRMQQAVANVRARREERLRRQET